MTALGRGLERALMPVVCVFCGARSRSGQEPICAGCYTDLPWIKHACCRCANPVATQLPARVTCADCQARPPPFCAAVAPLEYAFPIDAAIKAMKFKRRLCYAPAFAGILHAAVCSLPADIDGLLPVPLHWRRQATRGFNQSREICAPLGKRNGLQIIQNVRRTRATPYQSGLSAAQRSRNLNAAFALQGTLAAQHIVVVDDVITTGETCSQLAQVLLNAGARKVSVLALARASLG